MLSGSCSCPVITKSFILISDSSVSTSSASSISGELYVSFYCDSVALEQPANKVKVASIPAISNLFIYLTP